MGEKIYSKKTNSNTNKNNVDLLDFGFTSEGNNKTSKETSNNNNNDLIGFNFSSNNKEENIVNDNNIVNSKKDDFNAFSFLDDISTKNSIPNSLNKLTENNKISSTNKNGQLLDLDVPKPEINLNDVFGHLSVKENNGNTGNQNQKNADFINFDTNFFGTVQSNGTSQNKNNVNDKNILYNDDLFNFDAKDKSSSNKGNEQGKFNVTK